MFKSVITHMKDWKQQGYEIDVAAFGSKATQFFKRVGGRVVAQATHLGDAPAISDMIGSVKVMLDAYDAGKIDRLYLGYTDFVNTMTQKPRVDQLLPIVPDSDERMKHHWDYLYEPEAKPVMTALLTRYIESLVYQGAVENIASEQAARMVAMKSATDNAGDLINELQLIYNKARQAAITQEISEIVGGAAAV
jgi:F-type H+-transporting ATPase subunit gamma